VFGTPSTNSGYDYTRFLALDPVTGWFDYSSQIGVNYGYSRGFDVADFDLDNVDELLVGTSDYSNGSITAYDFNAGVADWQSPSNVGTIAALTHADMNADGYPDVIGITTNSYVYVFDAHAQTLLWKSTGLSGGGIDVAVADLDHDTKPEIIAALGDRLVIYGASGSSYLERASRQAGAPQDLAVADLDGDGHFEITVLDGAPYNGNTNLVVYNDQLQQVRSVPLTARASSLFVEDSAFTRKNVLVSVSTVGYPYDSPSELWAVDPVTGADVWRSPALVGSVSRNSLQFVDLNNDGTKEISFATNKGMNFTR
jgi:hypothetical protein